MGAQAKESLAVAGAGCAVLLDIWLPCSICGGDSARPIKLAGLFTSTLPQWACAFLRSFLRSVFCIGCAEAGHLGVLPPLRSHWTAKSFELPVAVLDRRAAIHQHWPGVLWARHPALWQNWATAGSADHAGYLSGANTFESVVLAPLPHRPGGVAVAESVLRPATALSALTTANATPVMNSLLFQAGGS